jgi:hypothetical protein
VTHTFQVDTVMDCQWKAAEPRESRRAGSSRHSNQSTSESKLNKSATTTNGLGLGQIVPACIKQLQISTNVKIIVKFDFTYKQAAGLQFLCRKSDQLIYHLLDYKLKLTIFILLFSPCIINSNINGTNNMHIEI